MAGMMTRGVWAAGTVCVLLLAGCGQFFPRGSSSSGAGSGSGSGSGGGSGSGSGSGTSNGSIYVVNSNPSLQSVTAFSLASGKLANLPNSPAALGFLPSALAINPVGTRLWVASALGQITPATVNSDGSLTLGASLTVSASIGSMAVDPSGNWLLALSNTGANVAPFVYVYQIDTGTGALTQVGTQIQLDGGTAAQIAFAPNGTQVFAALGTGGVDELSFNPSGGGISRLNVHLNPSGSSYADQGLAVDPTGAYLLVAETGTNGVRSLSINKNGTLTEVAGSPYATGLGAKAVLIDKTGAYAYVANSAAGNISAFTLSATGTLTALAGSPFTTGTSPFSLAEDATGGYLAVACAGGSPDLQIFSVAGATASTPGALSSTVTASTGNVSPAAATAVVTTQL